MALTVVRESVMPLIKILILLVRLVFRVCLLVQFNTKVLNIDKNQLNQRQNMMIEKQSKILFALSNYDCK